MNSTDYEVLLILGLLDHDKDKVPNSEDFTRKKYKRKNHNINPPSDGEDEGYARKM